MDHKHSTKKQTGLGSLMTEAIINLSHARWPLYLQPSHKVSSQIKKIE